LARPYQRRWWESNPLHNRFAGGCRAVWLQRRSHVTASHLGPAARHQNVLARSRTWSSTFAGSRANPPHSKDMFLLSAPPRNRTSSGSFEDCHAIRHTRRAVCSLKKYPDQDSNLDLNLRRVRCNPLHHRDRFRKADDWTCTSMMRFTKPPPLYSAKSASRSARIRTPCNGFGNRLLSQEHAPLSAPGHKDRERVGVTTTLAASHSNRLH
jgi:hypothetical protein